MNGYSFTLLISLLFISLFTGDKNKGWKKEREEQGITVYSRTNDQFSLKELKAVTIINNSSVQVISAIILDIENRQEWFGSCKSVEILETRDRGNFIYQIKINAPFPVEDRDAVQEIKTRQDLSTGEVIIYISSLQGYLPEEDSYLRMPLSRGKWILKPLNKELVEVEHTYLNDPGGSIPENLYNYAISLRIYRMVQKLIAETKRGNYGRGLDWIGN